MEEMYYGIASFYLYEEVEFGAFFPAKDTTEQWSEHFIGDNKF